MTATAANTVTLHWPEPHEDAAEHSDLARRVCLRLEEKGAEVLTAHVENWVDSGARFRPVGTAKNWTHKVFARTCVIHFAVVTEDGEDLDGCVMVRHTRLGRNGTQRKGEITVGVLHNIILEGNVWMENRKEWTARGYSREHRVSMPLTEHPDAEKIRKFLGMK